MKDQATIIDTTTPDWVEPKVVAIRAKKHPATVIRWIAKKRVDARPNGGGPKRRRWLVDLRSVRKFLGEGFDQ